MFQKVVKNIEYIVLYEIFLLILRLGKYHNLK